MTKSSYRQRLISALRKLGKKKVRSDLNQSQIYDEFERISSVPADTSTCLCGKTNLKYRFGIKNRFTKRTGILGSKCIKNIKRKAGYHLILK